jgi:hypothetical protein
MPTTWKPTQVEMVNVLTIYKHGTEVTFQQNYVFKNAEDEELPYSGQVNVGVQWSAIPETIQTSLTQISAYMKTKAEEQAIADGVLTS